MVQVELATAISVSGGIEAPTATHSNGRARQRSAVAIPAATTPAVKPTASCGVNLVKRSINGTDGARVPITSTGRVTASSIKASPRLRSTTRSIGSSTYSCASMAIDQKAPLGLGAPVTSWTSRPYTAADLAVGAPSPGCGTKIQAMNRLKTSAGQYADRMRQA